MMQPIPHSTTDKGEMSNYYYYYNAVNYSETAQCM